MPQVVTQITAIVALIVAIFSALRTYKVGKAQMALPRRLRQQAHRDELRKDAERALVDLDPLASRVRNYEHAELPESVSTFQRTGPLRAEPFGGSVKHQVSLCADGLQAVEIRHLVYGPALEERGMKRHQLHFSEDGGHPSLSLEDLTIASIEAEADLQKKRTDLLHAVDFTKREVMSLIRLLDAAESKEFSFSE